MRGLGTALRRRREELGLSLDEVAVATRIPVGHLKAIEQDRPQDLPQGPYAAAYARLLKEHLDLEIQDDALATAQVDEAPDAPRPPGGIPLPLLRALAAGSAVGLVSLIVVMSWQRVVPEAEVVVITPDQHVVVTARRSGRVRAMVDGQVVHDDVLPGGKTLQLDAHQRIELDVDSTATFEFLWNGEPLVPQGLQDHPRRLVFVDDVGPAPEIIPSAEVAPTGDETPDEPEPPAADEAVIQITPGAPAADDAAPTDAEPTVSP